MVTGCGLEWESPARLANLVVVRFEPTLLARATRCAAPRVSGKRDPTTQGRGVPRPTGSCGALFLGCPLRARSSGALSHQRGFRRTS